MNAVPLLEVRHALEDVHQHHARWSISRLGVPQRRLQAVRDVSLTVAPGETSGLVGGVGLRQEHARAMHRRSSCAELRRGAPERKADQPERSRSARACRGAYR